MSIVETVLVFVGIPVGVFALMALVVLVPGAAQSPRYRPGSPWSYEPVWYIPHPDALPPADRTSPVATPGAASRQLEAGIAAAQPATTPTSAGGGASGEW
jgi:hypothetical protein